ncbi:hypothetical protein Ddc_24831 [Ditylenchus destructor]|nr:hypothetical protein Ddc_24831 [Ditylenchus destructor]
MTLGGTIRVASDPFLTSCLPQADKFRPNPCFGFLDGKNFSHVRRSKGYVPTGTTQPLFTPAGNAAAAAHPGPSNTHPHPDSRPASQKASSPRTACHRRPSSAPRTRPARFAASVAARNSALTSSAPGSTPAPAPPSARPAAAVFPRIRPAAPHVSEHALHGIAPPGSAPAPPSPTATVTTPADERMRPPAIPGPPPIRYPCHSTCR